MKLLRLEYQTANIDLIINTCFDCDHYSCKVFNGLVYSSCKEAKKNISLGEEKDEGYQHPIPDFCPLPDAPKDSPNK